MGVGFNKHARVIESCSLKEKKQMRSSENAIHAAAAWFYLGNGFVKNHYADGK